MAATLGYGGGSSATSMNQLTSNQIMMEHLKALVTANPHYLTSGIPNNLLSQILMADPSKVQQHQQHQQAALNNYVCGIYDFL